MTLIRTSILNGIAVGARWLAALVLNKVLAVYVGPAGYGIIGQFQSALATLTNVASGAVNNGVVVYTAKYADDPGMRVRLWSTAMRIAVVCSLVTGAAVAVFSEPLAKWLLKRPEFADVFVLFAVFLLFFVLNSLLLAVLNGAKEIGRYVMANIVGSVIMAMVTSALTIGAELRGALIALSINQSMTFFATAWICSRAKWWRWRDFLSQYDPACARQLGTYALMAVASATLMPLSQMAIRDHLARTLGWQVAGYWQGVWRMSELYLALITTTLGVYYLPRMSEIGARSELRAELARGYKWIIPATATGAGTIFLCRDWLIEHLFSHDFLPMRGLILWQAMGDVLRMGGWLLGYVLIGKAMTKTFLASEFGFSLSFVALVLILTRSFGAQGAVIAYATNSLLYWATLGILLHKRGVL